MEPLSTGADSDVVIVAAAAGSMTGAGAGPMASTWSTVDCSCPTLGGATVNELMLQGAAAWNEIGADIVSTGRSGDSKSAIDRKSDPSCPSINLPCHRLPDRPAPAVIVYDPAIPAPSPNHGIKKGGHSI